MPIYQRSSPIGMLTDDTKAQGAAAITEAHVEATGAPRDPRNLGVEVVGVEEHVHENCPRASRVAPAPHPGAQPAQPVGKRRVPQWRMPSPSCASRCTAAEPAATGDMNTTEPTHETASEGRPDAHPAAHRTSGEILQEAAPFVEFAVPAMVRAVEVAAVVLLVLLVCPPLFILVVVVAVPLVALAALVAIAAAIVAMPCLLMRHLRGRRAHHTSLVLSRLRPLRGVDA